MVYLPPIFIAKTDVTFKSIALASGYMVHVWSATENGDEKDDYFWRRKGTRTGVDESRLAARLLNIAGVTAQGNSHRGG